MKIKKTILLSAFGLSLVVFLVSKYAVILNFCAASNYECRMNLDDIENLFLFGPILLPLIILVSVLPTHYFTTWWKFARIGLPLTLAAIVYINLTYTDGYMSWGTGFDLLIIGAIYCLFIIGSLISLAYSWTKVRR